MINRVKASAVYVSRRRKDLIGEDISESSFSTMLATSKLAPCTDRYVQCHELV